MTDHDPYGDPTRVNMPTPGPVDDPTQAMPATAGGTPAGGPPPPVMGPPPGADDRRGWILLGVLGSLVLILALALFLLSRDDDTDTATADTTTTSSDNTTTSSSTTSSSSTSSSTTTTAASPATVVPAQCTSGEPDDPGYSVTTIYKAFTLRDRDCADKLGTTDAVDDLFKIPGKGSDWQYQGCDEEMVPDPHFNCAYTFPGGATHFRTSYNDVDGWVIYDVFQTTD